jgi:hypothetical protein
MVANAFDLHHLFSSLSYHLTTLAKGNWSQILKSSNSQPTLSVSPLGFSISKQNAALPHHGFGASHDVIVAKAQFSVAETVESSVQRKM